MTSPSQIVEFNAHFKLWCTFFAIMVIVFKIKKQLNVASKYPILFLHYICSDGVSSLSSPASSRADKDKTFNWVGGGGVGGGGGQAY